MNTKAMISLDELVNKPDLIIQKLEKYGELVLIWNNEPYCVVSRVSSDEDEGMEVNPLSLNREEKPLPIASTRFASAVERENAPVPPSEPSPAFSSPNAWFAGNTYSADSSIYRPAFEDTSSFAQPEPTEPEPIEPIQPEEPKQEREMTEGFSFMSGFLPLQRTKKAPTPPKEEKKEPEIEQMDEPAPVEEEEATPSKQLDYVPYEVLKKQHANLWDIMAIVLKERPDHTMHAVDLARIINERNLYKTRDGSPVTPVQIRARVGHRPDRFQALGGNLIKLLGD